MSQSWNIIVCGDFPNPVVVSVPDPSKWRVTELKQEISKQAGGIPTTDITLYLGNTVIPEDKPLKECQGMRNGIAVLASIKPFVINVYCPDNDATLVIEVPKREFDSWTIYTIKEFIGFKRFFTMIDPYYMDSYLLVFAGNALTDKNMKISTIPDIANNCLMTCTEIRSFVFGISNFNRYLNKTNPEMNVLLPHETDTNFASTQCFYDRCLHSVRRQFRPINRGDLLNTWRITVQQLDGSKTSVVLRKPHDLSIRSIREAISKAISVPAHQQRLILGDTVLEDWQERGSSYREAMITDYHSFCDGVTLHLVQLTGGIRVNTCIFKSWDSRAYLNIFDPGVTTLKNVVQYMEALLTKASENQKVYLLGTSKSFSPSDDPVSSIEWITHDCKLTFAEHK